MFDNDPITYPGQIGTCEDCGCPLAHDDLGDRCVDDPEIMRCKPCAAMAEGLWEGEGADCIPLAVDEEETTPVENVPMARLVWGAAA